MKIKLLTRLTLLVICTVVISFCKNPKTGDTTDNKSTADEENKDKFDSKESEKTAEFIVDVVSANMAEIKMVQMAQAKTSDNDVKMTSQHMENDHSKLLSNLKDHAAKRNISIPSALTEKDEKEINSLMEKKPGDFEKSYLKELESRHEKSIDKFEKFAKESNDTETRELANNALPTLREHLNMIQTALKKYK